MADFGGRNSRLGLAIVGMILLTAFLLAGLAAPRASAAPTPGVLILDPVQNAVIRNGTPAVVSFAVVNFNMTDPGAVGQAPTVLNQGHIHVIVDGIYNQLVSRVETVFIPLPAGQHTVKLQLVNNNHTPLSPTDVSASVTFTVEGAPTFTTADTGLLALGVINLVLILVVAILVLRKKP